MASSKPNEQTVTALVENKAGVLARVVGLFARRGFNISTLAVAPTQDERFSRITFVYDVGSAPVEQVLSQVGKLINVLHVEALDPSKSVERELLLVTVKTGEGAPRVGELVAQFGARIVDRSDEAMTIMLADHPERLDELESQVADQGILAVQRTGRIALPLA